MTEVTSKSAFKPRVVPITFGDYTGFCRIMTGAERDKWVEFIKSQAREDVAADAIGLYLCKLIYRCLCTADGALIYETPESLNEVIDCATAEDAFKAVSRANKLSREDVEEEKKG